MCIDQWKHCNERPWLRNNRPCQVPTAELAGSTAGTVLYVVSHVTTWLDRNEYLPTLVMMRVAILSECYALCIKYGQCHSRLLE